MKNVFFFVSLFVFLIGQSVSADVWPSFHNNNQKIGSVSRYGPDCCTTTCNTQIEWNYGSPVIDDFGHVYIQGAAHGEGPTGKWYFWCVNEDCTIKWQLLMNNSNPPFVFPHSSGAIYNNEVIYIGNSGDSSLWAVDTSGVQKWKFRVYTPVRSSPVVTSDGSVIYVACDSGFLYAINSNNSLRWRYQISTTVSEQTSSPAIGNDNTIYVGAKKPGKLYAINPDGSLKWSYPMGGDVCSSPAFNNNVIYVGAADSNLYAINSDGSLKWTYLTGGNVMSSPALDYTRNMVYVGSNDMYLYALTTSSGTLRWRRKLSGMPGISSPAVAMSNNMIYIGDDANKIYMIENWGDSSVLKCSLDHDWDITSPAIDKDTSIWYNEYSHYLHKIKCNLPPRAIEEKFDIRIRAERNWPNPFRKETKISFVLPQKSFVKLDIYDITGKLVRTLMDGNYNPGQHVIKWDGKDQQGNKITAGTYLFMLKTDDYTATRKMTVIN
ncbi:MAG: PQQ-binding-like beta-propeller repeat protein [bacterium]|nr:PQQ-binding-like beta-propeller repeat protein [bacterium]